jgi:hypothetical protein
LGDCSLVWGISTLIINLLRHASADAERRSLHMCAAMWQQFLAVRARRASMYYLGIDWATEKHDLCLLDEDGTISA